MSEPYFLTLAEIIEIHSDQIKRYGGDIGVRDMGLLESAIAQPSASFGGEMFHRDLYEMASAYAFHIAQNHPFLDGNKRTAITSALVFLKMNGVAIKDPEGQLLEVMRRMASGQMKKPEFASILKNLSR